MNTTASSVRVTIKCGKNEKISKIRDSALILPDTKLLRTLQVDAGV